MAGRSVLRKSGAALRCVSGLQTSPLSSASLCSKVESMPPLYHKGSWFLQQLSITTLPRITLKKDRPLDTAAGKEKELTPVTTIRDLILKFKRKAIPFRIIIGKRRDLGLKMSEAKIENLMKRYPNIFEFFTHPEENLPWCRLTRQLMELMEEEERFYKEEEPLVVEKIRRLLMLAQNHRIHAEKLALSSRFFGFPDRFLVTVIPKYPQYFRLLEKGKILELVEWDESLAITEFEKKAKADAKEMGRGDIETRGQPLAFKLKYSPGMQLRKKVIQHFDRWQKLPYVCPYQRSNWDEEGTPLADKRMAALLHEILSLTIEKKILIEVFGHLREDFNLPQKIAKVFNRFPGVFYISLKGAVHTIFLREAYHKWQLTQQHPLIRIKAKYHKMVRDGPRLRSIQYRASRTGNSANAVPDQHKHGADENEDEDTMSDGSESLDEFELSDSEDEESKCA